MVDRCGNGVHHVITRDSVSGSILSPVPVVMVLATDCILLLLASSGDLSLSLSLLAFLDDDEMLSRLCSEAA